MLVDVSVCTHSLFDLQVLTVCTAQPLPFPQLLTLVVCSLAAGT